MPSSVAVSITYTGGTVDFYTEEIAGVNLAEVEGYTVLPRSDNPPGIMYDNQIDEVLDISFLLSRFDTETRLQTLLDAAEELTIVYANQWDDSLEFNGVPLIDGMTQRYKFGGREVYAEKNIRFLKSS